MESSNFVYDELEPGNIRLVRVLSCTRHVVELELKQFNTKTADQFYALSYVWGTAPPDSMIILNGYQAAVRHNLFAALKAIHNALMKDGFLSRERWVWIDAICINQNDADEKSKQVPLMDQIYSKAKEVFVWLGRTYSLIFVDILLWLNAKLRLELATEQADRKFWLADLEIIHSRLETKHDVTESEAEALWELYKLPQNQSKDDSSRSGRESIQNWLKSRMQSSKTGLCAAEHPFWTDMASLSGSEWYPRIWTYQEIYLASDARLLLPNNSISYWIAEQLALISYEIRNFERRHSEIETRQFQNIFLTQLYLENIGTRQRLPLAIHLLSTRGRRATDDRDIIYALLGATTEEARYRFQVNYTLSPTVVFMDAMHEVVEECPELLVVIWEAFSLAMTENEALPSWCPDFSNYEFEKDAIGSYLPIISESVGAKLGSYARAEFEKPYSTLSFNAWHIDKVLRSIGKVAHSESESVFRETETANFSPGGAANLVLMIAEMTKWLKNFDDMILGDISSSKITKLQRILDFCSCSHPDQRIAAQRKAEACKLLEFCRITAVQSSGTAKAIQNSLSSDSDVRAMQHLLQAFFNLVRHRHFLETASGKFGYSILPVADGDLIVYMPGGEELHVISWDRRRYRGGARVEGYMGDGLAMTLNNIINEIKTFHVT